MTMSKALAKKLASIYLFYKEDREEKQHIHACHNM